MLDTTNSSVSTAYTKNEALEYDIRRFSDKRGRFIHNIEINLLKKCLKTLGPKAKIIEIGCGTGRLMLELIKKGYTVNGFDGSLYMLKKCEKKISKYSNSVELKMGEASKLPYFSSIFDFVYSIRLLNQTESKKYALNIIADMIRIAKPNGYILVEFVNQYRPRLKRFTNPTVRIKPIEITNLASRYNTKQIWCRGAFLFGMSAFKIVPMNLLDFLYKIDTSLSRLMPKLCARCYILLRKNQD